MSETNDNDRIFDLHRQGNGYTAISKILGVPRTTVRRILDGKVEKKAVPIKRHVELAVSDIRLDGDTQMRVTLVDSTICEYREELACGTVFPPVTVFFDETSYWLADGFHRVHAAIAAGLSSIAADIYSGGARDAQRYAMGANANHGLRRTNADKRNAVEMALADPEWCALPNTQIAEMCVVAESFVRKIKQEREAAANLSTSSHSATADRRADGADQVDRSEEFTDERRGEAEPSAPPSTSRSADTHAEPHKAQEKKPFDWDAKFNPRLRRLHVTSPSGEHLYFMSREAVDRAIAHLEQSRSLFDEEEKSERR